MNVLLIEDDKELSSLLQKFLKKSGLAVDLAETMEDGLYRATEYSYDCIVLDINLPDGNGFALCKSVREAHIETPILMMTARDALSDKVMGLENGADDYVLKPVDSREVLARVRSLIRRSSKQLSPTIRIGDLEIDPQTQRVQRGKVVLNLAAKEYAVLEFLARHNDEVVTRSMLMEHVWGSDFETFSNVIDVYIGNLRRKIDARGKKQLLHTIRGSGYSLSDKR